MIPEIKYLPVNWVDGMKISKDHFLQNEAAHIDQIRDLTSTCLTDFNYGILPAVPGGRHPLEIKVQMENSSVVKVKLLGCRAITRGGGRIEITANNYQFMSSTGNHLEANYPLDTSDKILLDIIITVNPFNRMPVGNPDPEESPMRYPYTIPEYRLEIVPTESINITDLGAAHLTIGQIRVLGSEVKLSEHFIPPCTTVNSYPPLVDVYFQFGNMLGQMGGDTVKIIQKIKVKSDHSQLTDNMQYLADKMAFFLASSMDEYRMVVPQQPPIFMVIFFAKFARIIKTSLGCISNTGKEELLKYFLEWSELRPGTFENILDTVIELEYNHRDISNSLKICAKFIDTLAALFNKISQLDYIGKQKEMPIPKPEPKTKPGIFIAEEDEPTHTRRKGGLWNF